MRKKNVDTASTTQGSTGLYYLGSVSGSELLCELYHTRAAYKAINQLLSALLMHARPCRLISRAIIELVVRLVAIL